MKFLLIAIKNGMPLYSDHIEGPRLCLLAVGKRRPFSSEKWRVVPCQVCNINPPPSLFSSIFSPSFLFSLFSLSLFLSLPITPAPSIKDSLFALVWPQCIYASEWSERAWWSAAGSPTHHLSFDSLSVWPYTTEIWNVSGDHTTVGRLHLSLTRHRPRCFSSGITFVFVLICLFY
jgi:hypothetical protein